MAVRFVYLNNLLQIEVFFCMHIRIVRKIIMKTALELSLNQFTQ